MDTLISQNDLEKLYKKEIKTFGKEGVNKIINEKRNTEKEYRKRNSIFLCHSHNDKTIVEKIILLFNKLETNIYVDWMDETMPKVTNQETAEMIKAKIEHSHKFLFLATYYGMKSKWCDWELGLAYSIKKKNELAILPIQSRSGKWEGSEYLQLYPLMNIDDPDLENVKIDEISIDMNSKSIPLKQWLQ